MGTTDAGNSGLPTMAHHVIRSDFQTARRGFDRDEVVAYLGQVAEYVADLESRIQSLEDELQERERTGPSEEEARREAYDSAASRIADLFRTFDADVERLRADAQAEADRVVAEARGEAGRILSETDKLREEAMIEGQRIVVEARWKADQAVSDLRSRRAALLESCRRIQEDLSRSVSSVDRLLNEAAKTEAGGEGPDADAPVIVEEARGATELG